jgi:uncharacterized protein (TIGR02246 family)
VVENTVGSDAAEAAREIYRSLLTAWNERDAHGFADLFAPDGIMIGYDGSSAESPDGVFDHLDPIFTNHPTATYVAHVRDVRSIGADLSLLRAMAGMVPPGEDQVNPAVNALHTVLVRGAGETARIVLFQNTPAQYHGRQDLSDEHLEILRPQVPSGDVVT